jgi:hypothetical protein
MKITVLWDVKIDAICSINTLINLYQTSWCHSPENGYLHRHIKFGTLHSRTEDSTATLICMIDTVIKFKWLVPMYQQLKTTTKNNYWSMKVYTNTTWDSDVQLNTRENWVQIWMCDTDDVPPNCYSRFHISQCMMY